VLIKSTIPPGYEKTWGKVFISVHDLTERKAFYRAKERIINHLAHELKTPLSIIMSVIGQFSKKIEEAGIADMGRTFERGQRNVHRLLDLQGKIEDIIEQRLIKEKGQILNLIESAASIVTAELEEEQCDKNQKSEFIKRVSDRIESLFSYDKNGIEEVQVDKCLNGICDEAMRSMQVHGRSLRISRNIEQGIVLNMNKNVLNKIFSGLVPLTAIALRRFEPITAPMPVLPAFLPQSEVTQANRTRFSPATPMVATLTCSSFRSSLIIPSVSRLPFPFNFSLGMIRTAPLSIKR